MELSLRQWRPQCQRDCLCCHWLILKLNPRHELQKASRTSGRDQPERRRVEHSLSRRVGSHREACVRRLKIHVVEKIERLGANIQLEALSDRKLAPERKIN